MFFKVTRFDPFLVSMNSPTFTPCEAQNLALIQERHGKALTLTVEQTASLLGTSGNNVAQMLRRGHVPFDVVRVGARVLFPVPSVASWLCGGFKEDVPLPVAVRLPKRTPQRARSGSSLKDYLARLQTLRVMVETRAQALREAENAQEGFKQAREAWEHASAQVVGLVERDALRKKAGVTPTP
jgi:hypothetical protein